MRFLFILLVTVSIWAVPRFAACQETVASILKSCSSNDPKDIEGTVTKIQCMAYLSGMFDAFRFNSDMLIRGISPLGLAFCPPKDGVPNGEVIGIALSYMRREQDKTTFARGVAWEAWREAYKCPK